MIVSCSVSVLFAPFCIRPCAELEFPPFPFLLAVNIELAKAAHAAGVKSYLFISSAGTRGWLGGNAPYARMKQGVEAAVESMGFEQAIVMRPGVILGPREHEDHHPGGPLINMTIRGLGRIYQGWQDGLGQDAEVIGRAVVHAMTLAHEGKAPSKYWLLCQPDVVRLGRDEWKS